MQKYPFNKNITIIIINSQGFKLKVGVNIAKISNT